jgi:hypothetical protein
VKRRPSRFLRHLGTTLFFRVYSDSLSVAVFSAYFDASGNKRDRVLTVAGFVSRVRKWDRFNEEWAAILSSERVSAMHMTDFVSSKAGFESWKGQSDRRREFISRLSDCIRRNTNKGFASSVILSDWRELDAEFMLSESAGQPFTLCMRSCLGGLARWAKKKEIETENMLVAIEQGDEDQTELIRAARSDGFKVVPLDKKDVTAFQAGDLAAWKSRTTIQNAVYAPVESEEDAENIIRSLDPIKAIVQNNGGFDKVALRKMCVNGKLPRRTTAGKGA